MKKILLITLTAVTLATTISSAGCGGGGGGSSPSLPTVTQPECFPDGSCTCKGQGDTCSCGTRPDCIPGP